MNVAVIDHGAGNLVSMVRAFEAVGARPTLVADGALSPFDVAVLPGVGASGPAMRTLNESGLADELRRFTRPLLGVCVGMQLLFDHSSEDNTSCLGLIPGAVDRLDATPLPHIGWNSVDQPDSGLFLGLGEEPLFYFLHSFGVRPTDASVVTGTTTYGSDVFASSVAYGNVSGVQFHPERSGDAGLRLLSNFLESSKVAASVA